MTDSVNGITLRHEPRPDDAAEVLRLHETLYAREYGFDATFADHVAGPLNAFAGRPRGERERLWLAERDGRVVGCIAIVQGSPREAQLRWFLVDPSARGQGLGRRLMTEAVAFSRAQGYESIFLWTVDLLTAAARLYRSFGFAVVEARPERRWGVELVEQKYALALR